MSTGIKVEFRGTTKTATLQLHGLFGTGEGQISKEWVKSQLLLIGQVDELVIDIESKGGDAWEGLGIYRALNEFRARKIVNITYAMSTASWVAMVGDVINIAENGIFMYHPGRLRVQDFSTEEQLLEHALVVRQMNEQVVDIYAARTGRPKDQILAEMKKTTWLKGRDAVARGFAHKVIPNRTLVAQVDLQMFSSAPEWVRQSLVNVTTVAEQSREIDQLQILEKEYRDNAELIAKMGVTKQQYLESRMRTELQKRGIDPRAIGIGR